MYVGLGSFALGWAAGAAPGLSGLRWPAADPMRAPGLPLTPAGLLAVAAELGFRRVQLADNLSVAALDEAEWRQLLADARERGLALELGMRGLAEEPVRLHAARAAECRSPFLRIVIDRDGYEPSPEEIVRLLGRLVPTLEQHHLVLAIENHDRFRAEQLAGIIRAVDSEWIGICLDTVNSLGAGEGLDAIMAVLSPWVVNVHLKDFMIRRQPHQFGLVVNGTPLGCGWLTEATVRALLGRTPRCRSVTLEHWVPPAADTAATVAEEARWCRLSAGTLRAWFPESMSAQAFPNPEKPEPGASPGKPETRSSKSETISNS